MIDRTKLHVISGNGGAGSIAFRREKFAPMGGPAGGDGGRGGSIYAKGNKDMNTLLELRYRKTVRAATGGHGQGSNCHGADGKDLFIPVPLGTLVSDSTGALLCDIQEHDQIALLAKGGRGGKGNAHFKTSTRQTPRFAQPGEKGEDKELKLELKLIADVGLVGEPNAGKSTLLSHLSKARPKIADYPFTTLTPHLGLVKVDEGFSFFMADIPGLIKGAHLGKGLGHEFLRHIERTRLLVYVIDQNSKKSAKEIFEALKHELHEFNPGLAEKPSIIALNKSDIAKNSKGLRNSKTRPLVSISGVTGSGLRDLLFTIKRMLKNAGK
ncbi:MAG: GTPase ObgE [Fibrobacterota bacterium]